MMKKILICVISAIVLVSFISGCRKEKEIEQIDAKEIEITIYNEFSGNSKEAFIQYLKDEFDIRLNSVPWDKEIPLETLNGVLKIDSERYKAIYPNRHNFLIPINEIISSSSTLNSLPDNLVKALADEDGNIWGLLYSHRFNTVSRVYNARIMEHLNAEAPVDIDTFRDLLIRVKEETDTPVIKVNQNECADYFYDVFAAFGCPLFENKYTIGWSAEEGAFIDYATTEAMLNSLNFIKELNDQGIIEEAASSYTMLSSNYDEDELFTVVKYNNLGINDQYVSYALGDSVMNIEVGLENSPFIYVIPKGTKNPGEVMDALISSFYQNEKLNKCGRFGIEGEHYTYVDENFVLLGSKTPSAYPMLADYWINSSYINLKDLSAKEDYTYWVDTNKTKYIEEFYSGTYQILPITKSLSFERLGIMNPVAADFYYMFPDMFYKFLSEDQSVEEFLVEYAKEMNKLGIDEYLDEINN